MQIHLDPWRLPCEAAPVSYLVVVNYPNDCYRKRLLVLVLYGLQVMVTKQIRGIHSLELVRPDSEPWALLL